MAGDSLFETNVTAFYNFTGTDGATTFDDLSVNNLYSKAIGNAQILSNQLELDAAPSYLAVYPTEEAMTFGTGDFLIEFGVTLDTTASAVLVEGRPTIAEDVGKYVHLQTDASNKLRLFVDGSFRITAGSGFSTGVAYRCALSRLSGTTKLWVDETQVGSSWTDSTNYLSPVKGIYLGAAYNGTGSANGRIDYFRVTKGSARDYNTAPAAPSLLPYAGQITGNITESLAVTKWRVTATKCSDGSYAGSTSTTGSTYTINCNTLEACNITLSPHIDRAWATGYTPATGEFWVPSNPDTTPRLYECTTSGAVGGTEPTWPTSGTVNDGSAVWTFVADLDDGMFKTLGTKIPS